MTSASLNITLPNEVSPYDTQGRIKSLKDINVYQAVNDLHEQKSRNDLLVELKNKDKRKKLWEIYYGKEIHPSLTIEKDKKIVISIKKQLNELNTQRHLLRNSLYEISLDQPDETESNDSIEEKNE